MCDRFEQCRQRFDKIDVVLDKLDKFLFEGNGKEAVNVQLTTTDMRLKQLEVAEQSRTGWAKWRDSAVFTCALGILAKTVFTAIITKVIN